MSALLYSGNVLVEPRIKKTSTAFSINAFVDASSGAVQPATSSTTSIVGVTAKAVTSADTDYATSGASISVIVPTDTTLFLVDYTGGTPTEGTAYDLSDSVTVNVAGTSHKVVTCVKVVSSTQALFKINSRESVINGA